jgi:hypothetical protein
MVKMCIEIVQYTILMKIKNLRDPKENVDVYCKQKNQFGCLPGWYQICQRRIIKMETWSLLGARNHMASGHMFVQILPSKLGMACNIYYSQQKSLQWIFQDIRYCSYNLRGFCSFETFLWFILWVLRCIVVFIVYKANMRSHSFDISKLNGI